MLTAYALVVLMMIATFSLVTFIAPYIAETAGVGPDRLPLVLLGFGLVGAVGTFAGGRLTDRFPAREPRRSATSLAAAGYGVAWLGDAALDRRSAWRRSSSSPRGGSVAALAAQHRILVGAFRAPELASTLMSSVFNVGIAAGAALGAAALNAGMPVVEPAADRLRRDGWSRACIAVAAVLVGSGGEPQAGSKFIATPLMQ